MNPFAFTIVNYLVCVLSLTVILAIGAINTRHRQVRKTAITAVVCVFLYLVSLVAWPFDFFGQVTRNVTTKRKVVAITFDDGPSRKYTPKILDTLRRHDAHATFFVLGVNVQKHPDIARRMIAEGHNIGVHSWSHLFFFLLKSSDREHQILRTNNVIFDTTNTRPKYFRAPYEYRDERLIRLIKRYGFQYICHDVTSGDVSSDDGNKIAEQVIRNAHPGAIVLMHDSRGNREATIRALDVILDRLSRDGYSFVNMDELLAISKTGH